MCISDAESLRLQAHLARPCPRVELDARNAECFTLMHWLTHDDLRPLAATYAEALLDPYPLELRERVLGRVAHALRHRDVMLRLHPEPEVPKHG